jgi:thermitase
MQMNSFLSKKVLIAFGCVAVIGLISIIAIIGRSNQTQNPKPAQKTFNPQTAPSSPHKKDTVVAGHIIVQFKKQYSETQIKTYLKQYNASIKNQIDGINQTVVSVPKGQEEILMQQFRKDGYIEKAQRDYTTHTFFTPNDQAFTVQWGLNNTGQAIRGQTGTAKADIEAKAAWDVTQGNGIKVAILDTGINLSHPDLAGKVVIQKIFITNTLEDNNGHGTHVAGIIAADTNNNIGVAGVCPQCQLIIGKVMDDTGTGTSSDAVAGITWAADQGAKVINLSLGTSEGETASLYQQAVDYATQKGAVVVAAAGNDGVTTPFYPAATNGVLSVAATDNNDVMASFSNHGTWVKVAAPGVDIVSTMPNHANEKQVQDYGYMSGTSMAGPYVAGAAALVAATSYGTTPQAIVDRIYATADKIAGTGNSWVNGRLNATKAVGAAETTSIPTNTSIVPSAYCMGGAGTAPCATVPVQTTTTTQPSPTIINTVTVTAGATITTNPSGETSIVPEPTGQGETTPEPTTGDTPSLGDSFCSMVGSTSNQTTIASHHKHKKHHHHKSSNGPMSDLSQMLLQFIFYLLKLIGINPCPSDMIQ